MIIYFSPVFTARRGRVLSLFKSKEWKIGIRRDILGVDKAHRFGLLL